MEWVTVETEVKKTEKDGMHELASLSSSLVVALVTLLTGEEDQ